MAFAKSSKIWMNGEFVDWENATVHVLSHALHYGSSVFEGIRSYRTPKGPAVFRLKDHLRRLLDSAKIYRIDPAWDEKALFDAVMKTIRVNRLEECYVRPLIYRGYGDVGVNPRPCPVEAMIAVWEWGAYLGPEAVEKGVDVQVSTWQRFAPNTLPAMAKCAANYMNSQLVKMEALDNGFAEGIITNTGGRICEGSGENIFLVWRGRLLTPPLSASILPGITRESVITLAREMGYEVVEQEIPREALYVCDEIFFTGTAAEITPIRSVDRISVGGGSKGPVTKRLQERYAGIASGTMKDEHGWLDFVPGGER